MAKDSKLVALGDFTANQFGARGIAARKNL
jgi:hypothetical protein